MLLRTKIAATVDTNITANPVTSHAPTGRSQRNAGPRDCPTKNAPANTLTSIRIAEKSADFVATSTPIGVASAGRPAQCRKK